MATLEVSAPIPAPSAVEVFCSYSRKDTALREELDTHLRPLQAKGLINFWHDHAIPPGEDWENQIDERLGSAQIILLLVSPDFMASEPCQKEMERALELRKAGKARVIPILLRHVDWHGSPLGKLQALPKEGRPVNTWGDRDQAFKDVTIGIRRVAEKLRAGRPELPLPPPPLPPSGPHTKTKRPATKHILVTLAALVLAGAGYIVWRHFDLKARAELERLIHKDWSHVSYNDPDFSNCMDVPGCSERANRTAQLRKVSDREWASVSIDSTLLSDCMGLPVCVERANQAAQLRKVSDWAKVNIDFPLLSDCMGLPLCVERANHVAQMRKLSDRDWDNIAIGGPLLSDCMGYVPCLRARARTQHVDPESDSENPNQHRTPKGYELPKGY